MKTEQRLAHGLRADVGISYQDHWRGAGEGERKRTGGSHENAFFGVYTLI